jgi:hypothetical protein
MSEIAIFFDACKSLVAASYGTLRVVEFSNGGYKIRKIFA